MKLSKSFPNGKVRFAWLPSALNLADPLSKVNKDPISITNSDRYRYGQISDSLSYLDVHSKILQNTFYQCTKGEESYIDLQVENLKTVGFEDTQRQLQQSRNKYLKEIRENSKIEGCLQQNEQVNIA